MALNSMYIKGLINMKDFKVTTKIHKSQLKELVSISDSDLDRLRLCEIKKVSHSCRNIRKVLFQLAQSHKM